MDERGVANLDYLRRVIGDGMTAVALGAESATAIQDWASGRRALPSEAAELLAFARQRFRRTPHDGSQFPLADTDAVVYPAPALWVAKAHDYWIEKD